MRVVLLAALLLVGCVGPAPVEETPQDNSSAAVPTPSSEAPSDTPTGLGERRPSSMEPFAFHADHTIVFAPPGIEHPEATVPETFAGAAFLASAAQPITRSPFVSAPFPVGFETTGEFDITVRFMATASAVPTLPPGSGFPLVGGWFGTPERAAFYVGSTDAPSSLEANKVYTTKLHIGSPKGGFFVRPGESIAFTGFLNYHASDNSPIQWVVGGIDPAGMTIPHAHFNLSAPRATVILEEVGETGPNPTFSGETNPAPIDHPFKVPPDALYVLLEIEGGPKAGTTYDLDASIRTTSGEVLAAGTSPMSYEVAVIGPSALATAGRDLVAHVVSGNSATGGTYMLKITAYSP